MKTAIRENLTEKEKAGLAALLDSSAAATVNMVNDATPEHGAALIKHYVRTHCDDGVIRSFSEALRSDVPAKMAAHIEAICTLICADLWKVLEALSPGNGNDFYIAFLTALERYEAQQAGEDGEPAQ